jgi:hypothetical protein
MLHTNLRCKERFAYMTTAAEATKTVLTPQAFEYVMTLYEQGADKEPIPVEKGTNSNLFTELVKKNVVIREGATRGRNSNPGSVHILVAKDSIEKGSNRAPRGSKTPPGPRQTRSPRLSLEDALQSGKLLVGPDTIEIIHSRLAEYVSLTSPESQREWHLRQSKAITPAEIARLANQLDKEQASTEEVASRLTQLLAQRNLTFKEYVEGEFGKLIVKLLGIPEKVDTPEPAIQQERTDSRLTTAKPAASTRKTKTK